MIVRIVRMSFRPGTEEEFLALFEEHHQAIRNFPGCHHLDLLRERPDGNVFMTYSHWDAESDLEAYRHSAVFGILWPQVKALFNGRPLAWSFDRAYHLPTK